MWRVGREAKERTLSNSRTKLRRGRRSLPKLSAVFLALVAGSALFVMGNLMTRWVIANTRLTEWSTRPELESWADPNRGTETPAMIVGLAAGAGAFALCLALASSRARKRLAISPD